MKRKKVNSHQESTPATGAVLLPHRTAAQLFGIFLRILRAQIVVTFGLVLIYLANLGVAPWDMLAIGIANHSPLQYGLALNVVGICVILTDVFMREKIGLSTIQDVFISGLLIDLWTFVLRKAGVAAWLHFDSGSAASDAAGLSDGGVFVLRLAAFVAGVLIFCFGQFLVQSRAMGAGPRDTMVLGFGRKFPKVPIGAITWSTLALVFLAGLLLGGPFGAGTIGAVFGMSLGQQLMCRIFHFEPRAVKHENILETIGSVRKPAIQDRP